MGVLVEMVESPVPEELKIEGTLRPVGYKILVQLVSPDDKEHREKQDRLVEMPPEVRDRELGARLWAKVIELGPDAYRDEKRFPNGAWCKPGDVILMRPYSGTRFLLQRQEVREDGQKVWVSDLYALINDDTVQGITTEPERIESV